MGNEGTVSVSIAGRLRSVEAVASVAKGQSEHLVRRGSR